MATLPSTIADAINIRPMTLSDLLDRTIRLFRANFGKFFVIGAIAGIPMLVLQLIALVPYLNAIERMSYRSESDDLNNAPDQFLQLLAPFGLLVGVGLIAALLTTLTLVAQIRFADAVIHGRQMSIADAFRGSLRGWVSMIGASLLTYLCAIPLLILMLIPCIGMFPCIGIFAILAIAIGMGVRLGLSPTAIVIEQLGPIKSLKRSFELTRGHFWRLLGWMIVIVLLFYALVSVPTLVIQLGTMLIAVQYPLASTIASTAVGNVLSLALQPALVIALTALFLDQRNRVEGLDIEREISNIEQAAAQ